MDYPDDRRYSGDHEWLKLEQGVCRVGITVFAQEELGDVVFVELPQVGDSFELGAEIGTIESVKAVAELFIPISGEVVDINEKVLDAPELVNEDPHGEGWLVRIRPRDAAEIENMMVASDYQQLIVAGGT